jgi:hypothetical protein
MTDFNGWYAIYEPDLAPTLDDFRDEMQKAYEAGAASQAGTLRDEFAGRALMGIMGPNYEWFTSGSELGSRTHESAFFAYSHADAMLEARKTTGEGEA